MRNLAFLFVGVLISTQFTYAGFVTPEQERAERQKTDGNKDDQYISSLINKEVWYNRDCSTSRNVLFASPPTSTHISSLDIAKYIPEQEFERIIIENIQPNLATTKIGLLYTLRLKDGNLAYFDSDTGYGLNKIKLADPTGVSSYYCWFKSDPAIIKEQLKAKQEAREIELETYNKRLEAESKARERQQKIQDAKPGARIGMTKKQVLTKTSWGEPDDVNTTTTGNGELEQWIYDGGSYLYFKNGVLISIQN